MDIFKHLSNANHWIPNDKKKWACPTFKFSGCNKNVTILHLFFYQTCKSLKFENSDTNIEVQSGIKIIRPSKSWMLLIQGKCLNKKEIIFFSKTQRIRKP